MQVRAYAKVFFERYTELQEYEKYMKQIERGEQKIQRQHDIMKARRCRCVACLDSQRVATGTSHVHVGRRFVLSSVRQDMGGARCATGT